MRRDIQVSFRVLLPGIVLIVLCLGYSLPDSKANAAVFPPTLVDKPRSGVFLVAGRGLLDPNFMQSVILLTDHGQYGSIGLIVNKPTPMTVASALPDIDALHDSEDFVLLGGPVSVNSIRVLARSGQKPPDGIKVIDDIYFLNSLAALDALLGGNPTDARINFYAGYAGWAPGQLEMEIARGDWHLVKADGAAIFSRNLDLVWPGLIEFLSGQWVNNAAAPGRI